MANFEKRFTFTEKFCNKNCNKAIFILCCVMVSEWTITARVSISCNVITGNLKGTGTAYVENKQINQTNNGNQFMIMMMMMMMMIMMIIRILMMMIIMMTMLMMMEIDDFVDDDDYEHHDDQDSHDHSYDDDNNDGDDGRLYNLKLF